MDEYVSILEAARRCGISDKTIRRAIHAGKLAARYPKKNRAEVALVDLEAWHALTGDTTELRLTAMEQRIADLERQVEQLTARLSERDQMKEQISSTPPAPPPAEMSLPDGMVLLQDFADVHGVSRNEAIARWQHGMIAGKKEKWAGQKRATVAIGQKGMRDFWVQFRGAPGWRACNGCPHEKEVGEK